MHRLAAVFGDHLERRLPQIAAHKANLAGDTPGQDCEKTEGVSARVFAPEFVPLRKRPAMDRLGVLHDRQATFAEDQAVVIGHVGQSVLKSFGHTMELPRVALRDAVEQGNEPIVRPKSLEMPDGTSDSRYQLHGEIARGGMGAILKGRDTDLGGDLAIKVLLDQHKNKPEVVQRFIEEAQIGGQLQHPGIVPVYELGQFADQRPFFSMKLVKGLADPLAPGWLQAGDSGGKRADLGRNASVSRRADRDNPAGTGQSNRS